MWDETAVRADLVEMAPKLGLEGSAAETWIGQELVRLRRVHFEGYPRVEYASPHTVKDDPSVFARFSGHELIRDRFWRFDGLLARGPESGNLIVRRLTLEPAWTGVSAPPDDYDLTPTAWRSVRVSLIRDRAARKLRETPAALDAYEREGWPVPSAEDRAVIVAAATDAGGPIARPGRPGRGDAYYRRVARAYLAKLDERVVANQPTRGTVKELAADLGLSPTQARDDIKTARAKGFLTQGTRGRAGAEPGPNLNDDLEGTQR
jgi:hypothetical protein